MGLLAGFVRTPPVQAAIGAAASLRAKRFLAQDPLASQRRIFRDLIRQARGTSFGRDHDFGRLSSLPFPEALDHFRSWVPIRTYQEFWDDYFRAGLGIAPDGGTRLRLEDATWPGRVRMFCET
ncbi:MAG TPA: GH3 auxin-responsive promoter family protein, partial [Desulfuromonadaceae bacterium]